MTLCRYLLCAFEIFVNQFNQFVNANQNDDIVHWNDGSPNKLALHFRIENENDNKFDGNGKWYN